VSADTSEAIATATAKENGLKSYTGAVFTVVRSQEASTITATCETTSPSKTPPDKPRLVGEDILCPSGSSRVDRTSSSSTY
jgi:hypothetical protein